MNDAVLQEMIQNALTAGFQYAARLSVETLQPRAEVRDMCAQNRCGLFGGCWTCPPCCGTLAECSLCIRRYQSGILVQTVAPLDDALDYPGMQSAEARHTETFYRFYLNMKEAHPDMLALGAGGCKLCAHCTYPDAPCRFPARAVSSMEAYGLLVSDVCKANGLDYRYGPETVSFTGCYLFL